MGKDIPTVVAENPWKGLRQYTKARIALGRVGTSLPTAPHLDFQLAHARARNAVHHELDFSALQTALSEIGHDVLQLESAAKGRPDYLQRPDKGRRLNEASQVALANRARPTDGYDVAFVIGDGLSALAIEENAVAFLKVMLPILNEAGWRVAPLVAVKGARVAVGDEIGEALGAKTVVMLIGERPGLSSPDSMGIYLTYGPRRGLTDESRNCISNIRKDGLRYDGAAHKLLFLMTEARRRGTSGVNLKDEAEALAAPDFKSNFLLTSG
ncbi:MAG: ethanolamine ammonia-lyase subunit EutC [Hyphomicrobiaceae bacterium]